MLPTELHFCTYCNKFFMGARVVEHAMFHFRKDECTFCRTVFKDDLLAMVHLSDHIEKMKRLKTEETSVATPKTSAKAKATNVPSGHKEKLKNSASEPRTLRSNQKQMGVTSSHDKQTSKHVIGETTVHRVNGHIGKKESKKLKKDSDFKQEPVQQLSFDKKRRHRVFDSRLEENKLIESESPVPGQTNKELKSSDDGKKRRESLQLQETYSNPIVDVDVQEEKVFCPAKRCSWFTNLSKNRVGLLYHALDKHYGDIKPLELAFRVARSKCSICMRVMWSFEHFQHHIERHRLVPRHPCLHRGCKARFKSGMEMRRHTRKHSPLQAMCCRPGCSQLFICLWALNLHEREHYASKTAEPDSNANAQRGERLSTTPDGKKTQSSDDPVRFTSLKLKEQTKAPKSHKVVSSSLLKHKAKVKNRNRLKLKNARIATRGLKKRRCPPRLSKTVAGNPPKQPSPSDINSASSSLTLKDKEWKEGVVSMPCKKTLAAYGKKPYLRLPPTAYLDEKYTAMPKRRKESPLFQSNIVLESPCLKAALQRHRCAKCFSTFSCAEELQSHSQQQKCSNLFGFDSDDEGELSRLCPPPPPPPGI
uniref:Axoneme-associated protein mst101(2)-like n=1 Tax=Xiphophorus maculatus TaxID=8083 RepID=A0A3B5QNP1_XIPMA